MTILEPPAGPAGLSEVIRVLDNGPAILSSAGEHADLPPSVQEVLRTVVRLMQAGQAVTLYPAFSTDQVSEKMKALDELSREAYALGLYDRDFPAESDADE